MIGGAQSKQGWLEPAPGSPLAAPSCESDNRNVSLLAPGTSQVVMPLLLVGAVMVGRTPDSDAGGDGSKPSPIGLLPAGGRVQQRGSAWHNSVIVVEIAL